MRIASSGMNSSRPITRKKGAARDDQCEEDKSNTCQIWDAETARTALPLLPHTEWAAVPAFRPDGEVLAGGDSSGAVHHWDVDTGSELGPPLRAGSIVLSLAFSPDGRMPAVGLLRRQAERMIRDRPFPAWPLARRNP
jgi:WD40 repeat protein